MKTIRIEMKVDFDTDGKEEREKLLLDAAKVAAKHLLTTALLIQGKRKPQIALMTDDLFTGQEEIELADDIDDDTP